MGGSRNYGWPTTHHLPRCKRVPWWEKVGVSFPMFPKFEYNKQNIFWTKHPNHNLFSRLCWCVEIFNTRSHVQMFQLFFAFSCVHGLHCLRFCCTLSSFVIVNCLCFCCPMPSVLLYIAFNFVVYCLRFLQCSSFGFFSTLHLLGIDFGCPALSADLF